VRTLSFIVILIISALAFSYVTVEGNYVKIVFKPSYYDGEVDEVYLFGRMFDYVEMEEENGNWVALLDLSDGIYDYLFLVNGEEELKDPEAPGELEVDGQKRGAFGVVKTEKGIEIVAPQEYESKAYEKLLYGVGIYRGRVYFKLKDDGYDSAYVAGDFTDWEKNPVEMKNINGFWFVALDLEAGEH
jgi:hypothetical protein